MSIQHTLEYRESLIANLTNARRHSKLQDIAKATNISSTSLSTFLATKILGPAKRRRLEKWLRENNYWPDHSNTRPSKQAIKAPVAIVNATAAPAPIRNSEFVIHNSPAYLSPAQAAEYTSLGTSTILAYIKQGLLDAARLPAKRPGAPGRGDLRISRQDLDDFMRSCTTTRNTEAPDRPESIAEILERVCANHATP